MYTIVTAHRNINIYSNNSLSIYIIYYICIYYISMDMSFHRSANASDAHILGLSYGAVKHLEQ